MDNISDYISKNPVLARGLELRWQDFRRKYNVPNFSSEEDLLAWSQKNQTGIPDPILFGFAISKFHEAQTKQQVPEAPQQETLSQTGQGSNPLSLLGLPLLPFFGGRQNLMEDDEKFYKISEAKKKQWVKNNPGKDFLSREGLDYLYGSLDDPTAPNLLKETEKEFRDKHPKEADKYDREAKKISKNPENDLAVARLRHDIESHLEARKVLAKKNNTTENWDELRKKIERMEWDNFAVRYPEKATFYRERIPELEKVVVKKAVAKDEELIKTLRDRDKTILTSKTPQAYEIARIKLTTEPMVISQPITREVNQTTPSPNEPPTAP